MKFKNKKIFNPPLYLAVSNQNVEIVKLLLSRDDIDVNKPKISKKIILIKLNKNFNYI